MSLELLASAVGMFVVTNVDDLVVLAVFFGRAHGERGAVGRVVVGQYVGFVGILVVSVLGALGAELLPGSWLPYLGLVPIAIGVKEAVQMWRERGRPDDVDELEERLDHDAAARPATAASTGPSTLKVASVTFANGGDNIGVYIPVFAAAGAASLVGYSAVFLVMVAVWCGLGLFVATRPPVARALDRWGHIVLPVVLIAIGVAILVEGGAFGLG